MLAWKFPAENSKLGTRGERSGVRIMGTVIGQNFPYATPQMNYRWATAQSTYISHYSHGHSTIDKMGTSEVLLTLSMVFTACSTPLVLPALLYTLCTVLVKHSAETSAACSRL